MQCKLWGGKASWYLVQGADVLFPCSFKSFLNFRLSSTRLLIKWFLIFKKRVYFLIGIVVENL